MGYQKKMNKDFFDCKVDYEYEYDQEDNLKEMEEESYTIKGKKAPKEDFCCEKKDYVEYEEEMREDFCKPEKPEMKPKKDDVCYSGPYYEPYYVVKKCYKKYYIVKRCHYQRVPCPPKCTPKCKWD